MADSAARFPHPFTAVAGLRELGDGRVLVSDRGETRVVLVDFGTGDTVPVGGEGAGPGEYAIPGRLVPLPGDSTLLVDEGTRRLAVVRADGRMGATINPPAGILITSLGGVGLTGEIFFEGRPAGTGGADGTSSSDSVPILRWRPGAAHADTVARLRVGPLASVALGDPSGGMVTRISIPQPFAPGDAWGVNSRGELLILRAEPFRMERRDRDGAPLGTGSILRRAPVPVTARDREVFPFGSKAAESIQWPETKPPFVYGTFRVSPGGDAWVQLSTPADDPAPLYGILQPDGTLTRLVRLPAGRRLVGLGKNAVYAVQKDDDDLEWVERYAF